MEATRLPTMLVSARASDVNPSMPTSSATSRPMTLATPSRVSNISPSIAATCRQEPERRRDPSPEANADKPTRGELIGMYRCGLWIDARIRRPQPLSNRDIGLTRSR
jgi:hypothetical protein